MSNSNHSNINSPTLSSYYSIKTIARFEAKTLVRGWLFRIFASLIIIVIIFYDFAAFTNLGSSGDADYVIAGAAPYANMFLLNFVQAVIVVFLSSDFIGRDKKLDTTEAFYVRSVSNFSYVIGKTVGVVSVLFALNIIVLLLGLIFNIVSATTALIPITYLIYPMLLSLPTIILILGLSFFLMTLIKNQAVTFIIMIGLLGTGLFYLSDKWYNVLDFIGIHTPLAYSVFTGLHDLTNILLLRGSYILLGLGFIFFTVFMLPRLPQEKNFRTRTISFMLFAFIPAIIMISTYIIRNVNNEKLRAEIVKVEESLPASASMNIKEHHISLIHKGKSVVITSNISAEINNKESLSLILNIGFNVKTIKINGKEVQFERNLHVIYLKTNNIDIGEQVEIEIIYEGAPNDKVTFPEIPENFRTLPQRLSFLAGGKQISYITPSYILLTSEVDWYPVAASRNYRVYRQFTKFSLDATISPKLTAFSQGIKEYDENGKVSFMPEENLKFISFTAGNYVTRSLMVDSVEVTLALYPKNLKYLEYYFDEIGDTISYLLSEMKNDYERKLGLSYPFKRFTIIEVPIHFYTYPRSWTLATDDNMPEQLLIAERGGADYTYDPRTIRAHLRYERYNETEELLPKEEQTIIFKNIVGNMLFSDFRRDNRSFSELRGLISWNRQGIFPQYTTNKFGIEQEGFPVVQFIIENYLFSHLQTTERRGWSWFFGNSSQQTILNLKDKNIVTLLDSIKYGYKQTELVLRKGAELFEIIQLNIESQDINEVLSEIINNKNMVLMSVADFTHSLDSTTEKDISTLMENWLYDTTSPAFLFGTTRVSKIKDGNNERYFVRIQLINNGTRDGIVTIGIREQIPETKVGHLNDYAGFERIQRGNANQAAETTMKKTYNIPVGQPMEIGLLCSAEPRELVINTYVAQNLPTSRTIQINNINEEKILSFEGFRHFDGTIQTSQPYEYIVDNEDENFSVSHQQEKNTLKEWWMSRNMEETDDKYGSINSWRPSHKWQFVLHENFYGDYIKSVAYIRKGTGNNHAQWETDLPQSGHYSVYVYLPKIPPQQTYRGTKNESLSGTYCYSIEHDDGNDIVEIEISEQEGWHFIGDYYFSQGKATITLNDKTDCWITVADAVKWVRK